MQKKKQTKNKFNFTVFEMRGSDICEYVPRLNSLMKGPPEFIPVEYSATLS